MRRRRAHHCLMSAFDPERVFSGFSVYDLDVARTFYGETLGMPV